MRDAILAVLLAASSSISVAQTGGNIELRRPPVPSGTPVRLMVMNEVTSRNAHLGDRFALRVDESVVLEGRTAVPVGTVGWGEIVASGRNGAVGGRGNLAARLLYLELPEGRIPLRGDRVDHGKGNGAGVALAVLALGPLGLFNRGGNAKLKAGDIFVGYVE